MFIFSGSDHVFDLIWLQIGVQVTSYAQHPIFMQNHDKEQH